MVLIDRLINRLFISCFIEPRIKQYDELKDVITGISFIEFESDLNFTDRLLLKLMRAFNVKNSIVHINRKKNGFLRIDLSDKVYPTYLIGMGYSIYPIAPHIIEVYNYTCRGGVI